MCLWKNFRVRYSANEDKFSHVLTMEKYMRENEKNTSSLPALDIVK